MRRFGKLRTFSPQRVTHDSNSRHAGRRERGAACRPPAGGWRQETAYLSSGTQITGHPAYQELIALGPAALPFLFRELEQTGDGHMSNALSTITGAYPVPADERGQIRKIAESWLRSARENGYRW
jgi:hypothetical protein